MTEPGTGSDLQNVRTRAVRDGDHYLLNGAKTFITNGGQADLIIVVAKTDTDQRAHGISLFLVEADRPGFRRGRVLDKIGQHGQDTAELFFDDVRVPTANLLGATEGQGFIQLMRQLPQERLVIAIGSVAAMESALDQTLRYTKQRSAFGRKIFDFQNTKFALAGIATETRIARTFLDHCITRQVHTEQRWPSAVVAQRQ